MIRNHVLDMEASPQKLSTGGGGPPTFQPYQQQSSSSVQASEDPWFEQQNSPKSSGVANQPPYGGFSNTMGGGPSLYGASNVQVPIMTGLDEFDYDNEPPLLEELGIRFDHIWSKTQAVVNPTKKLRDDIFEDADLAGPLFFCLILGSCLLLAGKVHFGYIYGFSVFGCLGMHMIVNLLHTKVPKCRLSFGLYPLLIHCLIDTICFPQPDILIIHIPTALASAPTTD